ncbi:MAG: serine hydrolase [Holophagales bacterium]|nr:serine hydrolase [Holophagales bacterium]
MSHGMRNRAVLAGILGALLLAPSALGQAFFPGNDEIRRRLDERLARGGGVGVVVGLLDAGGTRRFVAAGTSGSGVPLDEHALFEIGSITKTFTATLLADMVARGEVALDDPVAKYLPAGTRVPDRGGRRSPSRRWPLTRRGFPGCRRTSGRPTRRTRSPTTPSPASTSSSPRTN